MRSVLGEVELNIKNPIWCMVNAIYCRFYAGTFCAHPVQPVSILDLLFFSLYHMNWSIRIALILVFPICVNSWCYFQTTQTDFFSDDKTSESIKSIVRCFTSYRKRPILQYKTQYAKIVVKKNEAITIPYFLTIFIFD